jgi:HK97 gp10 family phage protein
MATPRGITIQTKGLKDVLKNFKNFGAEGVKDFADITEIKAREIEKGAKRRAPVNRLKHGGRLRQSIEAVEVKPLDWKIIAWVPYAAFMEFGTGSQNVKVPAELKEIANDFRGADPNRGNIKPHPFLYPAFVRGRKLYVRDLNKALKTLSKKYSQ